jgi:hypothetical protein
MVDSCNTSEEHISQIIHLQGVLLLKQYGRQKEAAISNKSSCSSRYHKDPIIASETGATR